MEEQDFGLNDGFFVDQGSTAPANHTVVESVNGGAPVAIPNPVLDTEHGTYSQTMGTPLIGKDEFSRSFLAAKGILQTAGISRQSTPGAIQVGFDFRGKPVYSDAKLANSKDTSTGAQVAAIAGIALGSMNAFKDFGEATAFMKIGDKAHDAAFHSELDNARAAEDPKAFKALVGSVAPDFDHTGTDFTAYKLYENWNNLSPAQKSLAITGAGIQGFKFSDGQTFATKKLTPAIPGVPQMSVAQGLALAQKGVNVSPAVRKWNQIAAIQDTMFTPKDAKDVVGTAAGLNLLGFDMEGKAVNTTAERMSQGGLEPAPHYGVGAATIPAGVGLPNGYSEVGKINGRTIVVPSPNKGTALVKAPDVASSGASKIYRSWKSEGGSSPRQEKGVVGGSALAGGLDAMTNSNPYSLGAVITNASLYNTPLAKDASDLAHTTYLTGVSLHRLLNGNTEKSTDERGKDLMVDGPFTEENFLSTMKNIRGEYSRNGIASKEIGYQLANQGYAEGRFNESELVALHRSLDMAFDDNGYVLAQKLSTGKNKGLEIMERRRG